MVLTEHFLEYRIVGRCLAWSIDKPDLLEVEQSKLYTFEDSVALIISLSLEDQSTSVILPHLALRQNRPHYYIYKTVLLYQYLHLDTSNQ